MPKTKITSKGQVTVPKAVRDKLGLKPGDELDFVEDEHGFRLQRRVTASPFAQYRGILSSLAGQNPDAVVEEMRGQ